MAGPSCHCRNNLHRLGQFPAPGSHDQGSSHGQDKVLKAWSRLSTLGWATHPVLLSTNTGRRTDNVELTPSRYEMSNSRTPTPTCTFELMLLMSPGKVRDTETIIATAARQFCAYDEKKWSSMWFDEGLLHQKYTYTYHAADTLMGHRHGYDVRANTMSNENYLAFSLIRKTQAYISDHDSSNRTNEDGVPAHECQKASCTVQS